ncbi:MAG: tetratricopeptide repeat protein [Scytolyngbya sp. HA4215-MV1]|jgi:tetratricopeptide (TPR) repeat protein|nr:tetratricopeptide repeat protein [Scytolyngbya sp. HA4215-MV1]
MAQVQEVPAAVQQGYLLLKRGWVKDAIKAFQQAVQQYPQSVEARLGLAIAYRRAGQDEDAWQTYEQVLKIDPDNLLALKSVGLLGGFRLNWQNRGIAALDRLLQLRPNDLEALAQRALLYRYQGRFAEAIADYQILLQHNPALEVVLGAATTYSNSGNDAQALSLFRAYQQSGQKITGYAAIAYAHSLRKTGNPAAALSLLEPQLPIRSPDKEFDTQLRVELALAYLATQQSVRALAVLDELRGRSEAMLPLARTLNEISQKENNAALHAEATQLYRQALSQSSNPNPVLLQEVADVLSASPADRPLALQLYRQLVQQQPNDRGIQLKWLALERQLGYLSRSQLRERLRVLLQNLPTDPMERRAIAQGMVRIEPEPEFLPIYQTLLQTPNPEPFLHFRLAQIFLQQNQLTAARNALAAYTATSAAAGDLSPQLLAAEIERREGQLDAAIRRYEAIITANPTNNDILEGAIAGLADLQAARGNSGAALRLYDQLIFRNPQDLRLQMARASIAYSAKVISATEAEALLNAWVLSHPPTDTPSALFQLVGALPPLPRLEPLYLYLAEEDPSSLAIQLRLVQVLAQHDLILAKARVLQVVTHNQALGFNTPETQILQGRLALTISDFKLAEFSFQSALALQPSNSEALVGLADTNFQQRRFNRAEELYRQALAFHPNDISIQRSLLEVRVAQDYPIEAINQIDQLQQPSLGNPATPDLTLRRRKIEEDFLQRRGFQPTWERF